MNPVPFAAGFFSKSPQSKTPRQGFISRSLVSRVGFEPTTHGLKGRCSASELPAQDPLYLLFLLSPVWVPEKNLSGA
jgi:hypothetical protein